MKRIVFSAVLIWVVGLVICRLAEAKRGPVPEVKPLVHNGIKYVAANTPQKMGYIEAFDINTNRKVWEKKLYNVFINPFMEADVQWVFIKSLEIKGSTLVAINENNKKFEVDISSVESMRQNKMSEQVNYWLNRLNSWDKKLLAMYENPKAYPDFVDDGETGGWVSSCKEELRKLGASVVFDNSKNQYVIKEDE